MTATPVSQPLSHQSWEYELPSPGGITAGVDGSKESIAALNTASALARARHCPLHVVMALPPFASYALSSGIDSNHDNVNELRVSLKDSELREIVKGLEPQEDWTHDVIVGRPARIVTEAAADRAADMIVIGRRQHTTMDRVLGGETTLQIMRLSSVPVLAVNADLEKVETAVVAIDFSPSSIRAARVALELLGTSGVLYLAYVEPPVELLPNGFSLPGESRFPGDVAVWFRRLINGLGIHPGVTVETVVLNGRPVAAIVEFADRVGADLLAAGSHGHSRIERFLLGSVSTGLVRNAGCAVLVAPAAE